MINRWLIKMIYRPFSQEILQSTAIQVVLKCGSDAGSHTQAGLILGLRQVHERRRYKVMLSLIGWVNQALYTFAVDTQLCTHAILKSKKMNFLKLEKGNILVWFIAAKWHHMVSWILVDTDSCNGLSLVQNQTITWTNAPQFNLSWGPFHKRFCNSNAMEI